MKLFQSHTLYSEHQHRLCISARKSPYQLIPVRQVFRMVLSFANVSFIIRIYLFKIPLYQFSISQLDLEAIFCVNYMAVNIIPANIQKHVNPGVRLVEDIQKLDLDCVDLFAHPHDVHHLLLHDLQRVVGFENYDFGQRNCSIFPGNAERQIATYIVFGNCRKISFIYFWGAFPRQKQIKDIKQTNYINFYLNIYLIMDSQIDHLTAGGLLEAAYILSREGSVLATSFKGQQNVVADQFAGLLTAFTHNDPYTQDAGGIVFRNQKYTVVNYKDNHNDTKTFYLKKENGGACVCSTKKSILIGTFNTTVKQQNGRPQNPGEVNQRVESYAQYLTNQGC